MRARIRCAAFAAENDALKARVRELTDANSALSAVHSGSAAAADGGSCNARHSAATAGCRPSELETYKGMLQDVAASADQLARDNAALTSEAAQLRARCRAEEQSGVALAARVAELQVPACTVS